MSVKLSQTSKMPCKSWSLRAVKHCPGSWDKVKKSLVDACLGCYADDGFYRMPDAVALREFNAQDWEREEWEDEMVDSINGDPFFRWFDSGDCYSLKLAFKILRVMHRTPETDHWFPTRMGKFSKFNRVLRHMDGLPNVCVRHSSDSINGHTVDYGYGQSSTIVPLPQDAADGMVVCEAYSRGGKCGECRYCWDKSNQVIAYPAHGKKMARVIKLRVAA